MKKLTKCLRKDCLRKDNGIVFIFVIYYENELSQKKIKKRCWKKHMKNITTKVVKKEKKEEIKKKERVKYWFMPESDK